MFTSSNLKILFFFTFNLNDLISLHMNRVHQEPKASVLSAYKICDLAYKILKV